MWKKGRVDVDGLKFQKMRRKRIGSFCASIIITYNPLAVVRSITQLCIGNQMSTGDLLESKRKESSSVQKSGAQHACQLKVV